MMGRVNIKQVGITLGSLAKYLRRRKRSAVVAYLYDAASAGSRPHRLKEDGVGVLSASG